MRRNRLAINGRKNGQSILCDTHLVPLLPWTSSMKVKLKRRESTQVRLQISQESKNHKHHGNFNYLFWPDLARAHYSKESVAWMNENFYFVD
jgi:hypothetical protein